MVKTACETFFILMSSTSKNIDDYTRYDMATNDELTILVVGACTLDRSLVVPCYPIEDSKVRATVYQEGGGGNASNTAAALAKISSSSKFATNILCNNKRIRVKLISKVGSDPMGYQLRSELEEQQNVDVSFLVHQLESTTSHTTVIVSSKHKTRTCIHCPGTCGELTSLEELSPCSFEDIFQNVVWVHFDTRHTDFSLCLAREAQRRNIANISVDIEKDRGSAMTELINIATTLFTSATHLPSLLERTTKNYTSKENNDNNTLSSSNNNYQNILRQATMLCHHFCYKLGQFYKEVIVTNGEKGSVHVKHTATTSNAFVVSDEIVETYPNAVIYDANNQTMTLYERRVVEADEGVSVADTIPQQVLEAKCVYKIHHAGSLRNINVVDTTGAGDCFIAGFILSSVLWKAATDYHNHISNEQFSIEDVSLMMGSWVAGKKIGGLGTRASLPTAKDLDIELGTTDIVTVWNALKKIVLYNNII